jgi:hypothetical protein
MYTYGQAGLTLAQCTAACHADPACMQTVFGELGGACYPMSAASSEVEVGSSVGWTSVQCSEIPTRVLAAKPCKTFANTRSSTTPGISSTMYTYGQAGLTLAQCTAACQADPACMQTVFGELGGACYPMSAASGEVGETATSVISDCGKTHGHTGPSQAQCNSAYAAGSSFLKSVSVVNGIQKFTVPTTGSYEITAVAPGGAQQENAEVHGRGATVTGTVALTQGDTLWVLVGQQSDYYKASTDEHEWIGGSGGTFVAKGSSLASSVPLVVAGGAGGHRSKKTTENALMNGACSTDAKDGSRVGGSDTTSGSNAGLTVGFGYGGKDGYGGQNGRAMSGSHTPGGGAGFYGDGEASTDTRRGATVRAYAFRNGGNGGLFGPGYNTKPIDGGFGGGGSGAWGGTGGGGGYSGGGGDPNSGHSGGGGSYSVSGFGGCTSTNQGVGYVEISLA